MAQTPSRELGTDEPNRSSPGSVALTSDDPRRTTTHCCSISGGFIPGIAFGSRPGGRGPMIAETLADAVKKAWLSTLWSRDSAPARRREPEFGGNAHHYFSLPIRDRDVG
jgi:hypothetical protein